MQLKIGETLKKLRCERGITMAELAEALSVTPQSVSRWESGTSYPDIEMLPRIAEYFSVSLDKLMLDSDVCLTERLNEELGNMHRSGEFRSTLAAYRKEIRILRQLSQINPRSYLVTYFMALKSMYDTYHVNGDQLDRARESVQELLLSLSAGERIWLLTNIIMVEDEDKLILWEKFAPSIHDCCSTFEEILLLRYSFGQHEKDKWKLQQEKNAQEEIWKLVMLLAQDIPEKHTNCRKVGSLVLKPIASIENLKAAYAILNVFSVDAKDAFLHLRLYVEIRLAGALFRQDSREEAFGMLEQVKAHAGLLFSSGTVLTASVAPLNSVTEEVTENMVKNSLWDLKEAIQREEFDTVREDERFSAFVSYIKSLN